MKFFSTLKAERCLTQLSALHGSDSPEAHKALETLRAIGPEATPAVIEALDAQLGCVGIIKGPADIIVAAHIIDPGSVRRQVESIVH